MILSSDFQQFILKLQLHTGQLALLPHDALHDHPPDLITSSKVEIRAWFVDL